MSGGYENFRWVWLWLWVWVCERAFHIYPPILLFLTEIIFDSFTYNIKSFNTSRKHGLRKLFCNLVSFTQRILSGYEISNDNN